MQNKKVIEVRDLITEFDEKRILDNVSLDVVEDEVMVILGGSGCGKTTLLKHIIGLHSPVSGSIKIFDKEIIGMDEVDLENILKRVGVLFQNGALLNSLTIRENVAIPLRQHTNLSEPLIQRLVRTKLHLVELDEAINMSPAQLSGGMRKRAALARSIALDPLILFCDEPTAGLDPVTSEAIDSLIKKLNIQLNMTIVVITHELASIHRIADRIVFLDKGEVLYFGKLENAKNSKISQINNFFAKGSF
ncbi:MAG: ATP-binding cassette domain-containing protein [Candidatus Cloacimonetes bacterium]|nr:ATP-binding cassette domain-containing protein [Candidatus Cloacimonadota bacterium]